MGDSSHRGEVGGKLSDIRAWLEKTAHSGVVLGSQANFAWVTAGGHSHVSIGAEEGIASVVVTPEVAYLVTTNIELVRLLAEEVPDLPFEAIEYPWHEPERLNRVLDGLCDIKTCASDGASGGMKPVDEEFLELRRVLHPPEIDRYRALGADAAAAVGVACRNAKAGDTELDVAARIAFECQKKDILPLVNLVAADERIAAYRHPLPTPNRIARSMLVALTGRRHGLHASLTRMVSFGDPDDEVQRRHDSVTRVDARLVLESVPGASLGHVLSRGLEQYASEGYADEWKLHHQGGLTGYAGREIFATTSVGYVLKPGKALAWNPSITRVKSEDTIAISEEGFDILTRDPSWPERDVHLAGRTIARPSMLLSGT